MCGRFTARRGTADLAALFHAAPSGESLAPSFNVAPGQLVPVIVREEDSLVLTSMRWGLVPSWAKDPAIGNRLINARAETLAEKPSFRRALRDRRCLIPADGFYEWKAEGKRKVAHHITLADRQVFAFAGLWERWVSPEGEELRTCAIVTVAANGFMRSIHERMPAILPPADEARWLDPALKDTAELLSLLRPYEAGPMQARKVSALVNSPANNSPQVLLPLDGEDGANGG